MNKLFLTFSLTFLVSLSLLAQAPQSFNYQTVIRDINYEVLADQQLTLRGTGTDISLNAGLVNLSIGEGNVSSGNFESIDWANHTFFLEVAADFNNDNDFIVLGTSQLRSVPFALYKYIFPVKSPASCLVAALCKMDTFLRSCLT